MGMKERKGEISVACEIEKKIVRAENGLEKNESENEDGVVEHSTESLKVERSVRNFEPREWKGIGEWQLQKERVERVGCMVRRSQMEECLLYWSDF